MLNKSIKTVALFLLTAVLLASVAGCSGAGQGGKLDPAAVYAAIRDEIQMPEMMEVPESILLDYYGIDSADFDSAVFYMCVDSLKADEIVIVSAVDQGASARLESLLQARLKSKADQAEGYSPEQFAVIQKCAVRRDGLTVAMIVSPDAARMTEIYQGFLK